MEYPEDVQAKLNEFALYIDDDSHELSHISDPTLKLIYGAIMWDPDGVLAVGDTILEVSTDPLALVEAMLEAAKNIESDIEEHPDHGKPNEIRFKIGELTNKISQLKTAGKKSDIYKKYKNKREEN